MTAPADTLPFPPGRPSDYLPLADEPSFIAGQHLALEMPTDTTDLATLGYQESDLADCASTFAVSNAFGILSTEGVGCLLRFLVTRGPVIDRIIQTTTKEGIRHQFVVRVVSRRGAAPVDAL